MGDSDQKPSEKMDAIIKQKKTTRSCWAKSTDER